MRNAAGSFAWLDILFKTPTKRWTSLPTCLCANIFCISHPTLPLPHALFSMCVCVCVCVCVCARMCVYTRTRAVVRVCTCDNVI